MRLAHPFFSSFFQFDLQKGRILAFYLAFWLLSPTLSAQLDYTQRDPLAGIAPDSWLTPVDTFHRSRFYVSVGTGTALYGTASVGLYQIWYRDFPREAFKTFNDWPEWLQMDKAGHAMTAYAFSRYAFAGLRWSGLKRPAARYTALGVANLLQGTIETFDGFSAQWGFSLTDMAANVSGSLLFTGQDLLWREQRILLKVSNDFRPHRDARLVSGNEGGTSSLGYVTRERFGDGYAERFLKDYNAQTTWLSVNLAAFQREPTLPPWLNLAVGYGVENVYGALGNSWRVDGERFSVPDVRYRQWYLSPDLYFSRIPTRKRWVRLTLGILDFIKFPAPALEFSRGKFSGRWII